MELSFLVVWEWFQWLAIRLALFMALLTLGPSLGLILFDIVLYVFRTTVGKIPLGGNQRKDAPTVGMQTQREEKVETDD